MKILIAVDKFKGSLNADDVAHAISHGIKKSKPSFNTQLHPLADGGDGTIDILKKKLNLKTITCDTIDPIGRPIKSYYCSDNHTAFIELATSSGITLLRDTLAPMKSNTEGTGRLILDAIKKNHQHIVLAIGGSCSTDAGTGILHAMGYQFANNNGKHIHPNGEQLATISSIIGPDQAITIPITIITDVRNTLCGPEGAAPIFAPQKGANPSQVIALNKGLEHFAQLTKQHTDKDILTLIGGGAAGGVAAGLSAYLNTTIQNGFQYISAKTNLEAAIAEADLIITGEGKFDQSSFNGKVVGEILSLAQMLDKEVHIICGVKDKVLDLSDYKNVIACHEIVGIEPDREVAMRDAKELLETISQKIF